MTEASWPGLFVETGADPFSVMPTGCSASSRVSFMKWFHHPRCSPTFVFVIKREILGRSSSAGFRCQLREE